MERIISAFPLNTTIYAPALSSAIGWHNGGAISMWRMSGARLKKAIDLTQEVDDPCPVSMWSNCRKARAPSILWHHKEKGVRYGLEKIMATCRKCGGPIKWGKTDAGAWVPRSVDGGDHWDECREWTNNGTYGIKIDRVNTIGPIWTPGHNTKMHRKKIGLNPDCCCIPFDGPYIVYPIVDFL